MHACHTVARRLLGNPARNCAALSAPPSVSPPDPHPDPHPHADAVNIMPHTQQRPGAVPGPPRCGEALPPDDGSYDGAGGSRSPACSQGLGPTKPAWGPPPLIPPAGHGRTLSLCPPAPYHTRGRRGMGPGAPPRPPRAAPLPQRRAGGCACLPACCLAACQECRCLQWMVVLREQPLTCVDAPVLTLPTSSPPPTNPPIAAHAGKVPGCPPFVHKGRELGPGDVHDVIHDQVRGEGLPS